MRKNLHRCICISLLSAMLTLSAACAQNGPDSSQTSMPEAASGSAQTHSSDLEPDSSGTQSVKTVLICWEGGIETLSGCSTGLVDDISALAWLALRGGLDMEAVSEDISENDNEWIRISNSLLDEEESPSLPEEDGVSQDDSSVWVRIVQENVPPEAGTAVTGHRDYLAYMQEEDAYIAVQSGGDNELWNVWKIPGYGNWLEKEIRIAVRVMTGL